MKFIILLLLCIVSSPCFSFTLNSQNSNFRGWASGEINFAINPANCPAGVNVKSLMEDSIAVWNNISTTDLKLSISGTTTSTSSNNPVTVYCATDFSTVSGNPNPNSIPGAAVLTPAGDYAVGGYIFLNATSGQANIGLYNPEVLKLIIAHEVGHILGLGHSHEISALMYYSVSGKKTMSLSQDDIDGLVYLYPRDELNGDQLLGCAMIQRNGKDPTPWSSILLTVLILAFPILMARHFRRPLSPQNI